MSKESHLRVLAIKAQYKQSQKTYEDNIQFAKTLLAQFPIGYGGIIKSQAFAELWKDVLDKTHFLDNIYKDTDITRLYYYINKLTEVLKCQRCGKDFVKSFSPQHPPSQLHCDIFCAQQDQLVKDQIRHTKEVNHTTTRDLLERTKARNLERIGCEWYFQTDDFKEKALSTMLSNGYDHPMHSDEIKSQMSANYFIKTGYAFPFQNPEVQKRIKGKYFYDDRHFDSSPELAYYIWLKDNGIQFDREPTYFQYEFDGKTRFYIPDFIVEGQYIEIKGDQFFKEDGTMRNPFNSDDDARYEAKHQCMLKNNVRILTTEDYMSYIDYVKAKYGEDFLHNCKKEDVDDWSEDVAD